MSDSRGRDPFGPNNGKEYVGPTPPAPLEPGGSWLRERVFMASVMAVHNRKTGTPDPPPTWVFRPASYLAWQDKMKAEREERQARTDAANARFLRSKTREWSIEGKIDIDYETFRVRGRDIPGFILPKDADWEILQGMRVRVTIERLD